MHRGRGLSIIVTALPWIAVAACSASNGDPIPSEVRDAEALDVGSSVLPGDAGGGDDDADTAEDAAPKDAAADARDAAASSASVRINEVYVDRVVAGDKTEYVELAGAPGTPVGDLYLRLLDRDGNVDLDVNVGKPGEQIGATGTWVIATSALPSRVDRSVSLASWGLDVRGAVQLTRGPSRALVDVVGFTNDPDGGVVAPPATDPKATGEGMPYVLPPGTTSFGRTAGAADTGDNRADFCTMNPSAGAANGPCL